MKIDFRAVIAAFDACAVTKLHEIVVENGKVRFITSQGNFTPPSDPAGDWIKEHGKS